MASGETGTGAGVDSPPFVNRVRELDELRRGLTAALAGSGRLFLLSGEPGVGKTSLADALGAHAEASDASVLWGRCWEGGGAPPYWPWIQVLRRHIRGCEPEELERQIGDGSAELAQLIPELHSKIRGLPESSDGELEGARFALFEAVGDLLRRAGARRPLVLVLDDVHAADIPSLLLLRFIARDLRRMSVLVIATYREVEARMSDEIRQVLGDVARDAATLPLRGFAEPDVASLVAQRAGGSVPSRLAGELHGITAGNPFFIDEMVRLLVAERGLGGEEDVELSALELPHGVRELIHRRLEHVSEPARDALKVASVTGRQFRLDVVAHASAVPLVELVDLVEEAASVGIVTATVGEPRSFDFAHALFRETLYAELSRAERSDLHRRTGSAIEATAGGSGDDRLAELAHHFREAAWAGRDVDKAVRYAVAAAEDSDRRFAFEDAVEQYGRALEALALDADHDEERRCDLLLALGETQWRAAATEAAKTTFDQAGELARRLGSPERMARAALGFGGRFAWVEATGAVDFKLVGLLEAAIELLGGDGSDALRARLLGRLAMQFYFSPDRLELAHDIAREATEIADRSGDLPALAYALNAQRFVLWGHPVDPDRLALSQRILETSLGAHDTELVLRARGWLIIDYLELGDVTAAYRQARLHSRLADELRQPLFLAEAVKFRAVQALLEGRLSDAEQLGQEFVEKAQLIVDPDVAQAIGIHMFLLRGMQGRLAELEAGARQIAAELPLLPAWQCGLAFLSAEIGKEDEARRRLHESVGPALEPGGHAGSWVIGACVLGELCALFDDRARAEQIYEAIAPFSGTNIVIGYAAGCFGAADRTLGLLAATLGRFDDAERHLEAALELNSSMRAVPFVAWTKLNLAMLYLVVEAPDERIAALLEDARRLAEEAGADRISRGASELLARRSELRGAALEDVVRPTIPTSTTPDAPAPPERQQPTSATFVFAREGEYWTIGEEKAPSRLKDTKGLRHLARLLSAPNAEWYAVDLIAGESGGAEITTSTAAAAAESGLSASRLGDAGAALDERAKAEYRRRIEDLREELEEAESFSDPERAANARTELEFVSRELGAAVGLGGRDRKAASASERARVNVTRQLRSAIARIAENDEALGRHLDAAVKTGAFCSYTPEPWARIEWRFTP